MILWLKENLLTEKHKNVSTLINFNSYVFSVFFPGSMQIAEEQWQRYAK